MAKYSTVQPKNPKHAQWYRGGSATTPGGANTKKQRQTTAHRPQGK